MRTITLEEHFLTDSFCRAVGPESAFGLPPQLLDLGAGRIAAMDAGGIDLHVLSLSAAGIDGLDGSTAASVASGAATPSGC